MDLEDRYGIPSSSQLYRLQEKLLNTKQESDMSISEYSLGLNLFGMSWMILDRYPHAVVTRPQNSSRYNKSYGS